MEKSLNENTKERFLPIDPTKLESILQSRLLSLNVYNAAKMSSRWSDDSKWYVLDGEISENSWILYVFYRVDLGQEICVSRNLDSEITPDVKEAFSSTSTINWSASFLFSSVDLQVSAMLSEISTRTYGNCTIVHPCYLYYMDIKDGVLLDDNFKLDDGIQVKDLNDELGNKFMLSTWKYAASRSDEYIKKCLDRNESSGVYVNGTPVSGVALGTHGLISMLYTLKEYRGKGYAKFCMHSLMKNLANNGLVSGCTVELRNETSKAFQAKIGFKVAAIVDYVVFENTGF